MDHIIVNRPISAFELRKEKSRTALRSAMLELLTEKPFEEIQILDLTGRAKVGYATFFRHYPATRDVLDEIAGDQISELLAMAIPIFQQFDNEISLQTLCRYVSDRQELWRVLLTGGAAHSVRAEFIRQAQAWQGKAGPRKTSVPIDLGTICAAGSTIDALAWWLQKDNAYTADEMATFIDQLIITPFIGKT